MIPLQRSHRTLVGWKNVTTGVVIGASAADTRNSMLWPWEPVFDYRRPSNVVERAVAPHAGRETR